MDAEETTRATSKSRAATDAPGRISRVQQRNPGLPGAGPGLPPTAQRLLEAARRLLARSGYNSLSVEAIGREAGENKALIRYYFGSKNGLIIALVDWLVSDTLWQSRQRLAGAAGDQSPSLAVTARRGHARRSAVVPVVLRPSAETPREPGHGAAVRRALSRLPGAEHRAPSLPA